MLTPKQEAFVLAWLETGNASHAYRTAYSVRSMTVKSINEQASKVLAHPKVAARVAELRAISEERSLVTNEMVTREYARIAFASIDDVMSWNRHGAIVKDSASLSRDVLAAVKSVKAKTWTEYTEDGRERIVSEVEVTMHDKKGSLDSIAKIRAMFPRQPLIEVNDNRTQTLTLQLVDDILRDADKLID